MSHQRSEVHLAADLSAPPGRALDPSVFRIAIIGDFSGRSADARGPLATRRIWRVDRDDLDAALSGIAPRVELALDPGEPPLAIAYASLEDFHPDRLLDRLPIFQRLRALRTEAETAAPAKTTAPRPASEPRSVALDLSAGSLLDRIVDGAQPQGGEAAPAHVSPRDDLADFVSRAVRSHIVSESTPEQRDLVAKIDDVITATLRVVLHHPRVQALEALWRGVDFLVRRLETSESMQVHLVDVSRAELQGDLSGEGGTRSALHRLLADGGWSLFVAAHTFDPADAPLLATLAALGRSLGAPWLAGAHPRFLGVESFASDPDDWKVAATPAWSALRASPDAQFLSLCAPRVLARLPYGRRGEECESFRFEELGDGAPAHASFLWGNSAFLCALAIADSVASGDAPATRATIEGLPLYIAPVDGEPTATPCAEALLGQSAVEEILDAGLTALASRRDDDSVMMPRIQSVALPARPIAVRAPVR